VQPSLGPPDPALPAVSRRPRDRRDRLSGRQLSGGGTHASSSLDRPVEQADLARPVRCLDFARGNQLEQERKPYYGPDRSPYGSGPETGIFGTLKLLFIGVFLLLGLIGIVGGLLAALYFQLPPWARTVVIILLILWPVPAFVSALRFSADEWRRAAGHMPTVAMRRNLYVVGIPLFFFFAPAADIIAIMYWTKAAPRLRGLRRFDHRGGY
jgi:hypothetical protein